ncbi:MAG: YbhB/YbcL family Raf kinase inhibitor-like protein [Candidatus Dadabacteria bacterium]
MSLSLTSTIFKNGEKIPRKYTCDGKDISPPLSWSGVPNGTKSYAIILEDPDAPGGTFTHWVLYDLPVAITGLPEGAGKKGGSNKGSKQGVNDFGRIGYSGPCLPRGTHRYIFRLYALDVAGLNLKERATKEEVLKAAKGHVISEAELVGTYSR